MTNTVNLDWNNLGFDYIKTDLRFISYYKDGEWDEGALIEDNVLKVDEAATALHYGQQCFEGLKAYRCKDGSINLFRVDQNAARMARSCRRLYIRPFMIGVGNNVAVRPATEYIFSIFVMPVGAYFKGGLTPTNFIVSEYDRAAHVGTGAAKVGGNYAASLLPGKEAKERHFSDCIYLDPLTHTKIEEVGAANFFGITKDNQFITPYSPSILPSITKYSLLWLAEHRLGMTVKEGDVYVDQLDIFAEAGACGTAAVISPVGGIQNGDDIHVFYSETDVGPVTRRLYDE